MSKVDDFKNVLYIDLSEKEFHREKREDLFDERLGGTGVATRLLKEECPEGADPLGPDNPIILATGPLTGLYPLASKTVSMFKSPHTGNLGESHCGGRSAASIRMSGHGAIVIKGESNIPIYLAIHGNKVRFRDAATLWGMDSSYTVGRIIRENEGGSGHRTIMRIGKGGEKQVTYAGVVTETYRHFGRMGLGAVFGSKKLKGVLVSGKSSIPTVDQNKYRKLYDDIYDTAVSSDEMNKYHNLGTPKNVLPLNEINSLPTKNLQETNFDKAEELSGEKFAEENLGRRLACSHCQVGCIHIANLREPYEDEPFFYKTTTIGYDYEPIYALGSMLGIETREGFLKLLDEVEKWGLDAMSTGVVLAWATEAFEKGIVTTEETMGVELEWGDHESYIQAVDYILEQPNKFYEALSKGLDEAVKHFGGEEFSLSLAGNEIAGYHTGPAYHIGHIIGGRHGHLDNAGYSLDQKTMDEDLSPQETVDRLVKEEKWRQILSSLVTCFFARGIYDRDLVVDTLGTVGYDLEKEDLDNIGEEIYKEKMEFKVREGYSLEDIKIPRRIIETKSGKGEVDREHIEKALNYFDEEILV